MVSASRRLHEERIRKGITLEEAAKATKIRLQFLEDIENGQYNKLPSGTYAQGFVANYAEYLGLPKREMHALFRREFQGEKDFRVLPQGLTKKTDFPVHQRRVRQTVIVITLIVLLGLSYLFFQYRSFFFNPPLDITSPKNNAIIKSQSVTVNGKTDPNASLLINSLPVTINSDGTFSKTLDVFTGKTTIKITATNKFGKVSTTERIIDIQPVN